MYLKSSTFQIKWMSFFCQLLLSNEPLYTFWGVDTLVYTIYYFIAYSEYTVHEYKWLSVGKKWTRTFYQHDAHTTRNTTIPQVFVDELKVHGPVLFVLKTQMGVQRFLMLWFGKDTLDTWTVAPCLTRTAGACSR